MGRNRIPAAEIAPTGRVWVVGSINQDLVILVDQVPAAGETCLGKSLDFLPGGKGANQAVAAQRYSGRATFVGRVGQDPFAVALRAAMVSTGLDLHLATAPGRPSGTALIWLETNGENRITVVPGANHGWGDSDLRPLEQLTPSDILVVQNEIDWPTTQRVLEVGRAAGAKTILNPAPARSLIQNDLRTVDYLILNEREYAMSFPASDLTAFAEPVIPTAWSEMVQATGVSILVTRGARGVTYVVDGRLVTLPGQVVNVVDTVGAGDCFIGAFAAELLLTGDETAAIRFANAAAACSVTQRGAWTSYASREQCEAMLRG